MKIKKLGVSLGIGLAMSVAGTANATTIAQGLVPDVLNTIEDQDRETFFDVDGSGTLSIGDVFVGFVRFDNFLPAGMGTDNQVYGVISNQIVGFDPGASGDGTLLELGTTTAAGLTLPEITGDVNTAGGMFAVYDTSGSYGDLISAPVGTGMADNTDLISNPANGTLRLVAGLVESDDYLWVDNGVAFGIGAATSQFAALPTSVTVGNFTGGLSFLYNNTKFDYSDSVITVDALGDIRTNTIGIGNGAIRGAVGDGNEDIFGNGSGYGTDFNQCTVEGVSVPCGFVTDADFFVNPSIPVPAPISLFGAVLLGLGGMRRLRK